MSDITEEDVMKYCYSRNLMLVTKESLESMHRPIVIETMNKNAIPVEWIKKYIVDNTKIIDDLKYEVGANPVNYYIYPQQITKMLTAWWEKENEIDRS